MFKMVTEKEIIFTRSVPKVGVGSPDRQSRLKPLGRKTLKLRADNNPWILPTKCWPKMPLVSLHFYANYTIIS